MRSAIRAFVVFAAATAVGGLIHLASGRSPPSSTAPAEVLHGLWSRTEFPVGDETAPVAFYYFHEPSSAEGGIGLFRFGKIGHNTTNSYDWIVDGADLRLRYKKTGEQQALRFRVEGSGNGRVLVFDEDPKSPGRAGARYRFITEDSEAGLAPDLFGGLLDDPASTEDSAFGKGRVAGRMWIDVRRFATGGSEFSLWQFRPAGIDGRGTGWHHVGDFDDWSTEALSFRETGAVLDLQFSLRREKASTGVRLEDRGGTRFVTLASDPRGFWAERSFQDAGPSFGAFFVEHSAR